MSYIFLVAQGEESSAASFSAIPASMLSRSKSTRARSYSKGSETECCHASQSGTISLLSTGDRGEGELMSSAPAGRARTSVALEKAQDSAENGRAYGLMWPASSAKFDRATSSWKIHPCLFPEESMSCSVTLPKWGTMRRGELSALATPELRTSASGSGYWPTARTRGIIGGSGAREMIQNKVINGELSECEAEKMLGVKLWPTPAARDYKGANSRKHCETNGTGRKHMDQLANAVAFPDLRFATPQARDFPTGQRSRWENQDRTRNLNDQIGGQLNPTWVEWLMGWPICWTSMEPITDLEWRGWETDPADVGSLPRVATGIKHRVGRLKAIGNGQVPQCAAMAWRMLIDRISPQTDSKPPRCNDCYRPITLPSDGAARCTQCALVVADLNPYPHDLEYYTLQELAAEAGKRDLQEYGNELMETAKI